MGKSKTNIVKTTTWSAGPGCHGGCGVLAHIKDNKYEIKDANGLWGLGIPETLKRLTATHGKNSRAICIGPAGENLVKFAAIMNDHGMRCFSASSWLGANIVSRG